MISALFDPENRFWSFMQKICDLFFLSLCWLLLSVPLLTSGAATVSLYRFTLQQAVDREGYPVRSFFRGFKHFFKKATILWLLFILAAVLLYLDFYLLGTLLMPGVVRVVLFSVFIFSGILFLSVSVWAFPLLAYLDMGVKATLRDAFVLSLHWLPVTVVLFAVRAAVIFLIVRVAILFFFLIPLGFFLSSLLLSRIFSREFSSLV